MPEYGSTEPWHPITDPVDIKYLGKFMEECGEGVQAASRCLIQGFTEWNEKEQRLNLDCLQDEIADIEANIELLKQRFNLRRDEIQARVDKKIPFLKQWHEYA